MGRHSSDKEWIASLTCESEKHGGHYSPSRKEKPSVWWSDITLRGRQIRRLIFTNFFFFCPVRGFSVINPPRVFPEIAAVVLLATGAEWFMVMSGGDCSSSTSSDLLSSPWRFLFFLSFFFLSLKWMWITVCLFHFMLEWQQLYPQCVPISPFRAVGSGVGAGAAEGPRGTSCCSHKAGPPLIMLLR